MTIKMTITQHVVLPTVYTDELKDVLILQTVDNIDKYELIISIFELSKRTLDQKAKS